MDSNERRAKQSASMKRSLRAKRAAQITKLRERLDAWIVREPEVPTCAHGIALTSECDQCIAAVAKPEPKKRGGRRKAA